MTNISLKVENLWKQYRLGLVGAKTLKDDIQRIIARIRGKEDPLKKIGTNQLNEVDGDYVWALQDINFQVEQGEVLGIIGKNGAGKSTLLKILSKVTGPSQGKVYVNGRIASLLEVGTGFQPELTGRENIFLNGAILGMKKREIREKLDEIVAFSGVEKYLDTPVKRYSSGMYVRLAFAVAAHLEPEILVVDEVLAVGDVEFQKKALGKMNEVSQNSGRTVLFVSHNMGAIKKLCQKCLLLQNGKLMMQGNALDVVTKYQEATFLENTTSLDWHDLNSAPGNENIRIRRLEVKPTIGRHISIDSGINIIIEFFNFIPKINLDLTIELLNQDESLIFHQGTIISNKNNSQKGCYSISVDIPPYMLNTGFYTISLIFGKNQSFILYKMNNSINFYIENIIEGQGSNCNILPGIIRPDLKWNTKFNGDKNN